MPNILTFFSSMPFKIILLGLLLLISFGISTFKTWSYNRKISVCLALLGILSLFLLYNAVTPRSQIYGKVLWRGNREIPIVALTFDDGPNPIYTPKILKTLKKYNIKATFFLVGKNVEKYPKIVREIANEGHLIGNHTFTHTNVLIHTEKTIANEIKKTERAIYKVCKIHTKFFRPPYGFHHPFVFDVTEKLGYKVVLWSITSLDWGKVKYDKEVKRIINKTRNGDIILFHDSGGDRRQTLLALPDIIEGLKNKGFNFVTVEEMFNY